VEKRKEIERDFHNKIRLITDDSHVADTRWSPKLENTIKNNPLWKNMKYYSVERKSRKFVLNWFKKNCRNKYVLDYCAGNGEDAVYIAKHGAEKVTGIDISDVSIENCKYLAGKNGVGNVTEFIVSDAENTGFDDNLFDIITEYGALHHLDRKKAFPEMARILRSDGKIICNEALGHNPIIHLYRKKTPLLRTEWEVEHIMRKKDFEMAQKYFGKVEVHFFHFFTLLAVPFRNFSVFPLLLHILEGIDSMLLKFPGIKWWAWQVVFILSEPKRHSLKISR
jgi:ubiquinone/menaquinone biosynthesis C-methylase UbiE